MARISSWNPKSRPTALVVACAAALFFGCGPENANQSTKMILIPDEAHPGILIPVAVLSDAVNFAQCRDITPESFNFSGDGGADLLSVQHVQISKDENILRADILIDNTAMGPFDVSFTCSGTTILKGTFRVTEAVTVPTFDIQPSIVETGAQNLELVFESKDEPLFGGELIQLNFDDGVNNHVQNVSTPDFDADTPTTMSVIIDISSAEPPKDPVEVTVVTSTGISSGTFQIVPGSMASIAINGESTFFRPDSGGMPLRYTIEITGTNIEFTKKSTVTFPVGNQNSEAPGIAVVGDIQLLNSALLEMDIEISQSAYIGATRLRISNDDVMAETQMSIKARASNPVLALEPREVPRGSEGFPVVATARNFEFSKDSRFDCVEVGCTIDAPNTNQPVKQVVLRASIDAGFEGTIGTVRLQDTGAKPLTLSESLIIVDSQTPLITPLNTLTQGDTGKFVSLQINGGLFEAEDSAQFLDRSGLRLLSSNISLDRRAMYLQVSVANDAPVGQTLATIQRADQVLDTLVTIEPSKIIPWVSASPNWIAQGRRVAVFEIEAHGFVFDESTTTIRFDDSAIKMKDIEWDSGQPEKILLTVELSPVASSETTVLYVQSGTNTAATTFRVLDVEQPRFISITPTKLVRGEGAVTFAITTENLALGNTPPFVEVMNGIGVYATTTPLIQSDIINVRVVADEVGEEGWVGILIKSNWHQIVAPIYIANPVPSTPTLTMAVYPSEITIGEGPFELDLTLPPETGSEFSVCTEVTSSEPGSYASLPEVGQDNMTARIRLDLGYDISDKTSEIKLFATTSEGGAVGIVTISPPAQSGQLDSSTPNWESSPALTAEQFALLNVNPTPKPSMLYSSNGRDGYAYSRFELISELNLLDTVEKGNRVFVWGDQTSVRCIVSPFGNPHGKPVDAILRSLVPSKPITIPLDGLNLTEDPCESPVLAVGRIDGALDTSEVHFGVSTGCRLAAAVIARRIIDRAYETPDTVFFDEDGNAAVTGWPTAAAADPTLYIPAGKQFAPITIGAEHGTNGNYLLNIRRPYIIREINRHIAEPYVVLETEPGASLESLVLQLVDEDERELEALDFSGLNVTNDGIIIVSGGPMPDADLQDEHVAIFPPKGTFALRLFLSDELMDAVQIGTDGIGEIGEGDPVEDPGENSVLHRVAGIDTNDNRRDFVALWESTY